MNTTERNKQILASARRSQKKQLEITKHNLLTQVANIHHNILGGKPFTFKPDFGEKMTVSVIPYKLKKINDLTFQKTCVTNGEGKTLEAEPILTFNEVMRLFDQTVKLAEDTILEESKEE